MTPIACPHCGRQFAPKPELIGRTVRCPGCKEAFQVQAPAAELTPLEDDADLRLAPDPSSDPLGIGSLAPGAARPTLGPSPLMGPAKPPNPYWEAYKRHTYRKTIIFAIFMGTIGLPALCICSGVVAKNFWYVATDKDFHAHVAETQRKHQEEKSFEAALKTSRDVAGAKCREMGLDEPQVSEPSQLDDGHYEIQVRARRNHTQQIDDTPPLFVRVTLRNHPGQATPWTVVRVCTDNRRKDYYLDPTYSPPKLKIELMYEEKKLFNRMVELLNARHHTPSPLRPRDSENYEIYGLTWLKDQKVAKGTGRGFDEAKQLHVFTFEYDFEEQRFVKLTFDKKEVDLDAPAP
jgi:hypothetical protein